MSPQRFTPRGSSALPGKVRRALDGAIESSQRFGDGLGIEDGRLVPMVVRGGGLKVTRGGLMVDAEQVGEKNRPALNAMRNLATTATTADVIAKVNELLAELQRTGNMKGLPQ
jgi:hypothetical protein